MTVDLGKVLNHRNVRQIELARRTGLTRGYISSLVSGRKKPSTDVIQKIATALDMSAAELFLVFDPNSTRERGEDHFAEDGAVFIGDKKESAEDHPKQRGNHVSLMRAVRDHLSLAIVKGDILHVDLSDKTPNGRIAVTTAVNTETGEATTLVRRMTDTLVLPENTRENPLPLDGEDVSFAVLGVVIKVERYP